MTDYARRYLGSAAVRAIRFRLPGASRRRTTAACQGCWSFHDASATLPKRPEKAMSGQKILLFLPFPTPKPGFSTGKSSNRLSRISVAIRNPACVSVVIPGSSIIQHFWRLRTDSLQCWRVHCKRPLRRNKTQGLLPQDHTIEQIENILQPVKKLLVFLGAASYPGSVESRKF